jgi:WD40 repeat protein
VAGGERGRGAGVATGDPVRELPGHTDVVTGLAFGPGAMLVSAGGDGVRIWDTDSARCRVPGRSSRSGTASTPFGGCR